MKKGHWTLDGERPVHPECPGAGGQCQCDMLWAFWDGTDAELDNLIDSHLRLDMRRSPSQPPCSVNIGEELGGIQVDPFLHDDARNEFFDGDAADQLDGFYKESELLKCVRDNRNKKT